jgi:hypothetical protein
MGHIDPATGRNKRDNTRRTDLSKSPRRWNGRIVSRAQTGREQRVAAALRRRERGRG